MKKSLPDISDKPHQPNITFKKTTIAGKTRSFQYKWFTEYPWLHYSEAQDKAYCFNCVKSIGEKLSNKNFSKAKAFTYDGFDFWNKGPERFKMHQLSVEHKEATCKVEAQKFSPVDEILDKQLISQRAINRKCLIKIIQNVRFMALNNIAFLGEDKKSSKFYQLAELRGEDDMEFLQWINKPRGSYMHSEIQNELLEIMGHKILRESILKPIQNAPFFALMCDESTDRSNKEQMVICLRTADDTFKVREDFIGLYQLDSTTSEFIFKALKDVLLCYNLPVSKVRGQSYDGAANKSGSKNGVVTKIQEIETRAVYIHCYGHLLNLATANCLKSSRILKDTLEYAVEIIKLITLSPKRESKLNRIKEENGDANKGIKPLW